MEDKLKQGETLFIEGKIDEAEKCFLDILKQDPKNAEAFNNLGAIHYNSDNINDAEIFFLKALEIKDNYLDALLNLADLYQNAKRWEETTCILEKTIEIINDDYNILNQLGIAYLETGNAKKAIDFLSKSLKINPDQEVVRESLKLMSKENTFSVEGYNKNAEDGSLFNISHIKQETRIKIAVLCLPGLDSFLGDIVDHLKTQYDVRTCYSNNNQEIESAVNWADIVWLEWANELTIALTNHPNMLNNKHIICRLHSYEALTGFAGKIKWEKIDDLIFVADHIKEILLRQIPNIDQKIKAIHVIPNGINLHRFSFKEKNIGYNLAYLGSINYKKGPMLLMHAFMALVETNSRYKLFIAGDFQDARYKLYFDHMIREMDLQNNIQFSGWVEDVNVWLEDKQYILCTSVLEGHPVGLMEAMTCGLKPIVHNFVGARGIYPDEYVWNTIPDFINMISNDNYNSNEYRSFITDNYNLEHQLSAIDTIISSKITYEQNYGERATNTVVEKNSMTALDKNEQFKKVNKNSGDDIKLFLKGKLFSNALKFKVGEIPLRTRLDILTELVTDKKILHLGCSDHLDLIKQKILNGTWLHKILTEKSSECIGVDINEESISYIKTNLQYYNVHCFDFISQSNEVKKLINDKIDYIILGEILEHVNNPVEFLKEIKKRYKDIIDKIVITVPNAFRYENFIFANNSEECINSDHRYWFTPYTILKVMNEAGIDTENNILMCSGFDYNGEMSKKKSIFRDTIIAIGNLDCN